jgi:hypothetical protein
MLSLTLGKQKMANGNQAAAKRLKMAERAQNQLDIHFPNIHQLWVWNRKRNDGWITIPRTLPIAMQAIDAQSKGAPAGHTLFCLWARCPDHVFMTIEHPATFAAEAGFTGVRAVDTWRKRMKILRDLGFLLAKPGPSGEFHYILLMNPIASIERLHDMKLIQDGLYSRFIDRIAENGSHGDLKAFREAWEADRLARAAAAAAMAAAAGAVAAPAPPPPPPAPTQPASPPPSTAASVPPPPAPVPTGMVAKAS